MDVLWVILLVAEAALVLFIVFFGAPLAIFGWDRLSGWWYDVTDAVDALLCWMFPKLRAPQLPLSDEALEWATRPLNQISSTGASATNGVLPLTPASGSQAGAASGQRLELEPVAPGEAGAPADSFVSRTSATSTSAPSSDGPK